MPTALVTGASGFVGSHICDQLHQRGYAVRVLARSSTNLRSVEHLPIIPVRGDFADPESLSDAVRDVDFIYHVAGATAAKNRAAFFAGNQLATRNLLEAALRHTPNLQRFLHVSSLAAVGPAPDLHHPVDETTPFHPITTYGESKAAAEREVFDRMSKLPATIVRPPVVYGPRDAGTGAFTFFAVAAKGLAPLIGFGEKKVSLVHVTDLARGSVEAAESPRAAGEAYFLSSEEFYTWEEVGAITAKVMGRKRVRHLRVPHAVIHVAAAISGFAGMFQKKPTIFDRDKGRDITTPYWICSVEKAREHFGYRQQIPLEQGIIETIAWYRKEGVIR